MSQFTDEDVATVMRVAGVDDATARFHLQAHNGQADIAVAAILDGQDDDMDGQSANPSTPAPITGPRTLDGRPAPASQAAFPKRASQPKKRTGLTTFSSLANGDDDDDDDDDHPPRRDLFAGGEKSGLAVQDSPDHPDLSGLSENNANSLLRDILRKARQAAEQSRAGEPQEQARTSTFTGTARTIGGDGVESRTIPDPHAMAPPPAQLPVQQRTIHLWSDGFSVDEGENHPFSDPANQENLRMIRDGRAPLALLNVRNDQHVDVHLEQHPNEPWRQLPRKHVPFSGQGQRLGSPVPGAGNAPPPEAAAPAAAPAPTTNTDMSLDSSQPIVSIRIQLPDGSRLPARFNLTHTVGDIYSFVSRSDNVYQTRPYVITTTFPNKDHKDKTLALGDMPEFRKGGVAIVKWT